MSKEPPEHLPEESKEQWRMAFGDMKAKRKGKQSPTNALTQSIRDYIDLQAGCKSFRINTTGVYDPSLEKFRHTAATLGVPDILAIMTTKTKRGWFVGIEVKMGKDAMRQQQIKRMEEIIKCGGRHFIAKDFDSTKKFIDNLLQE